MSDRPIILAAIAWWRSRRPCSYNQEDHLRNPLVNTTTNAEKRLARVVANRILGYQCNKKLKKEMADG
jgi:hypothetical protein